MPEPRLSTMNPQPARRGTAPEQLMRGASARVILIGFQNQGNLGLGYLSAVLRQHGHTVTVLDCEADPQTILEAARKIQPVLMGFSLIFQFYLQSFSKLIDLLRDNGVHSHFIMGGHFPSLSYRKTLELVPNLDSVGLFEAEYTLLDLVDRLASGQDWRNVAGLAYREENQLLTTPLRPLVPDLDALPYPDRDYPPTLMLGHTIMPILASRGCPRQCSFCSIQTFYRNAPGKIVRTRQPFQVVAEMNMLFEQRGVTIFLFQDDDFPLTGPVWRRWAREFISELHKSRLPKHIIWKINSRADDVDAELFSEMKEAGLYLVYLGLESGTEQGLKTLNKGITVEQNLRAVEILKQTGLVFEYGFMLFDPSSTFESIRANIRFLRTIVGDGSTAATFCKMLPYDGTPIQEQLARSGRLRGDVSSPDYDFLDRRLNEFYNALTRWVNIQGWFQGPDALGLHLRCLWAEIAAMDRLFPSVEDLPSYREDLREITREANATLLQVVEDLSYACSDGSRYPLSPAALEDTRRSLLDRALRARNRFVFLHQDTIMRSLGRDPASQRKVLVEI